MSNITAKQQNFIASLLEEIGEGAPKIENLTASIEAIDPEDTKSIKESIDAIIKGLKAKIREVNASRPVSDNTYKVVRQCDAENGESTEREGLTEADARKYIQNHRYISGTGKPSPGQRGSLFKNLRLQNPKTKTADLWATIDAIKTYNEASTMIQSLLEANYPVTDNQRNAIEKMAEKLEVDAPEASTSMEASEIISDFSKQLEDNPSSTTTPAHAATMDENLPI
jgi:hypothetical protein